MGASSPAPAMTAVAIISSSPVASEPVVSSPAGAKSIIPWSRAAKFVVVKSFVLLERFPDFDASSLEELI